MYASELTNGDLMNFLKLHENYSSIKDDNKFLRRIAVDYLNSVDLGNYQMNMVLWMIAVPVIDLYKTKGFMLEKDGTFERIPSTQVGRGKNSTFEG